jgi:hypothetical protein
MRLVTVLPTGDRYLLPNDFHAVEWNKPGPARDVKVEARVHFRIPGLAYARGAAAGGPSGSEGSSSNYRVLLVARWLAAAVVGLVAATFRLAYWISARQAKALHRQ